MPPPPSKWKGKCDFTTADCSNKLIGARSFITGETMPFDEEGHGTHTASTAAGGFVENANIFGNANGTAVGMAPLAHIAMYKVCGGVLCDESAILAGMDSAIADGVDVLSVSIGDESSPFYSDSISHAAYSAMEKGIFVSCSAGNAGSKKESLSNEAPWILTVGASTIDRKLVATAVLGNNEQLDGQSAFQPKNFSASSVLPLVFPGAKNTSDKDALSCKEDSLKNIDIQGKIVVCLYGSDEMIAKKAGAAAVILINEENLGYTTFAEAYVLPVTHISYVDSLKLKAYINSTSTPTAHIAFKGTLIGDDDNAPVVAGFSSRGPSLASPGILKPDIIGPGVNILAAWPVSVENYKYSKSTFNMISGTSMSCPHLSGIAALLKSEHPDWSPAAIKSAIMTTADVVNRAQSPIEDERFLPANIFATGAGHVNPSRASDPGLIYDLQPQDYIPYLCGLNYTDQQVGSILRRRVNCSEESSIPQTELNYPSFALTFSPHSTYQSYTRTATNVGELNSSYTVEIAPPPGIEVLVQPTSLNFSELNKKIKYRVAFIRLETAINNTVVQGHLKWTSTKNSVRSPIVVMLH
ncbi:hypothetical protein ACJIZ3_021241 [Penstemon smallii]|uniref:Uncharacterized protein n=1 Tax=Penstemon smallii TaxID=265156 RepID=A0ABD3SKV8_9LAMI